MKREIFSVVFGPARLRWPAWADELDLRGVRQPCLGQLCEIPGLRPWRVTGFPVQWLYFEVEDRLDVVRLLGDRQDIIAILTTGE